MGEKGRKGKEARGRYEGKEKPLLRVTAQGEGGARCGKEEKGSRYFFFFVGKGGWDQSGDSQRKKEKKKKVAARFEKEGGGNAEPKELEPG